MTHSKIFEHQQQVLNDTKDNGNKITGTKLAGQVMVGDDLGNIGKGDRDITRISLKKLRKLKLKIARFCFITLEIILE